MRLIDADKLWKATTTSIDYCGEFLEIIEKQETVEAILVDWIEAFLAEHDDGLRANIMIKRMIEYWRFEQEGN